MAIKWRKEEPLAYELVRIISAARKEQEAEAVKPGRPAPKPIAKVPAKRRERRSDLIVAALGITLCLICALFPWYIFFNQDEFGIRALKFNGNGTTGFSGPIAVGAQAERIGAPMSVEPPDAELDLFATGTLPPRNDRNTEESNVAMEQPFPVEEPVFRIIHVENGRAMVEDDGGMWIVQRGSSLPDNSRVAAIEQRGGRWVVVTSSDRVLEVTP